MERFLAPAPLLEARVHLTVNWLKHSPPVLDRAMANFSFVGVRVSRCVIGLDRKSVV